MFDSLDPVVIMDRAIFRNDFQQEDNDYLHWMLMIICSTYYVANGNI